MEGWGGKVGKWEENEEGRGRPKAIETVCESFVVEMQEICTS